MLFAFLLALALLPGSVAQTDVSGTWKLAVESQEGTANPTVSFIQNGEKLSGTYRGRMGQAKLEGTLRGNAIQFTVTLRFRDQSFVNTYSGTVSGETMSGRVQFADAASGKWSGKRPD
jgi:hypothetical protein